jgi:hypothetical protein
MEGIVASESDSSLVNGSGWKVTAVARRVRDQANNDNSTVSPNDSTKVALTFSVTNGVANTTSSSIGSFDGNVELMDVVVKDGAGRLIAVAGQEPFNLP